MRNNSPSLLVRLVSLIAAYWVFSMGIIFIHEAAHYVVARANNIGVFKFQVGYGPTLVEFSTGDCSYELCLYPLGGFNAIAEDYRGNYSPEEVAQLVAEHPEVEQYLDRPETWMSNKSPMVTFLVAMAGVVTQIGVALIMLLILWFKRHSWLLYPKFQRIVDVPISGGEGTNTSIGIRRVLISGRSLNFWKVVFLWLFVSNISLAISNTAPGQGLDGLLALRSYAEMVHGDALTQDVLISMVENAAVAFVLVNAVFSLLSMLAFLFMFVAAFLMPTKVQVLEELYFPGFGPSDDEDLFEDDLQEDTHHDDGTEE